MVFCFLFSLGVGFALQCEFNLTTGSNHQNVLVSINYKELLVLTKLYQAELLCTQKKNNTMQLGTGFQNRIYKCAETVMHHVFCFKPLE
jgi:hypothetical protein